MKLSDYRSLEAPRFLGFAAYALGALFIVLPLADIALGLLPLQFGNLRWRIGAVGLGVGAMMFPILGMFTIVAVSHLRGDVRIQYASAAIILVTAIVLIGLTALFTLDTLQLRREVAPQARHVYDRAALKGIVAQLFTIFVLTLLSVGSLRASRAAAHHARTHKKGPDPIVMARLGD